MYGRTTQTLVLQDRKWDETNTRIFPKTTQLLQDIGVSACGGGRDAWLICACALCLKPGMVGPGDGHHCCTHDRL